MSRPNKKKLSELVGQDSARYVEVSIKKARALAAEILESEEYQSMLKRRACAGVLNPKIEMMLWWYLFGRPPEKIEIDVNDTRDLEKLTNTQLAGRAKLLAEAALALESSPTNGDKVN